MDVNRLSYTITEAAVATGLSKKTIENLIIKGDLKAKKLNRKVVVIPASALKKLVGESP